MFVVTADSANDLYTAVCRGVLARGNRTAPRGMATTEVLGAHLMLTQPRRRFVNVPPARVLNPAFAVAEALWILSGSDDPWIFTYNRGLKRYADEGRLQGAYEPVQGRYSMCALFGAWRRWLPGMVPNRVGVFAGCLGRSVPWSP